jgi:L-Ala-D/L-Glu epimerase
MVGCMMGTSRALASTFLLCQFCDIVDLDAPLFLAKERQPGASYKDGKLSLPGVEWGEA